MGAVYGREVSGYSAGWIWDGNLINDSRYISEAIGPRQS